MKRAFLVVFVLLMEQARAEETEEVVAADLFYSPQQKARLFAKAQAAPDSVEKKTASPEVELVIEGVWRNRIGHHAMIGGKIFEVGQTIEGARIARIDKGVVEFNLPDTPLLHLRVGERLDFVSTKKGNAP